MNTPIVVPPRLRAMHGPDSPRIARELGFRPAELRVPSGRQFLFLCFTNRCGSTFFAQLLYTTDRLAYAGESFSADAVLRLAAARGQTSFQQYVSTLKVEHGWTASKLGLGQLLLLADSGILQQIRHQTHFILLERQDRLAQAISRVIAFETGRWTSSDAGHAPPPAYARAAIDASLAAIEQELFGFYAFFAANAIVPLSLTYEDVLRDPFACVAQAGEFLGLGAVRPHPKRIELRRQADALNAAWRGRYLAGE